MNKNYCVYMHTNKINGKRYIGMTKLAPEARWGRQGSGYRHQPQFYNEILEYGWDNFSHEIICDNLTKKEAQIKEVELMNQYDTKHTGYNKNGAEFDEEGNPKYEYHYYKPVEKKAKKVKLIYCIELNRSFLTTTSASEETGVDSSAISKVCRGVRGSAGKHPVTKEPLHWIYIEREVKE